MANCRDHAAKRCLTWPSLPGAAYRLELIDTRTEKPVYSQLCDKAEAELPDLPEGGADLGWQVMARGDPVPGWHVVWPLSSIPAELAVPSGRSGLAPTRISWPRIPEATAFRLAVRTPDGKPRTVYRGPAAEFALPETLRAQSPALSYRVKAELDNGETCLLVPWVGLSRGPAEGQVVAAEDAETAPAYRLYLRDEHADEALLDLTAARPSFVVDRTALPRHHQLRYRIFAWEWRERKWRPITPYRRLDQDGTPD